MPLSYTTAYTVFGLGCVVAAQIPNNAGSLAPLEYDRVAADLVNYLHYMAEPARGDRYRHLIAHPSRSIRVILDRGGLG